MRRAMQQARNEHWRKKQPNKLRAWRKEFSVPRDRIIEREAMDRPGSRVR